MDYHQNARLTVHSREQLASRVLEQGLTLKLVAASFNVSPKTAAKWVRRYREQGLAGLGDRSSRPLRCPRITSSPLLEKVLALRRLRYNGWRIAREVGMSRATVSRILRRAGMNRLRSLDPPPPVVRYEHKRLAASSTSISSVWLASSSQATASMATALGRRVAQDTSICTSPSTITAASASPPSCPTRPTSRPFSSSSWLVPSTPASDSPSAASSPTMGPATDTEPSA